MRTFFLIPILLMDKLGITLVVPSRIIQCFAVYITQFIMREHISLRIVLDFSLLDVCMQENIPVYIIFDFCVLDVCGQEDIILCFIQV